MGQRLVITIKKDNDIISALYYHWGAYTQTALETASEILDVIQTIEAYENGIPLTLIRHLESKGGCITSDDYDNVCKIFPNQTFNNYGNRNNGLIALTPHEINHLINWAEGTVEIDLDNDMITFAVYWSYYNDEEYEEEYKDYEDFIPPDKLTIVKDDIEYFHFSKIDEIKNIFNSNSIVKDNSGAIYISIE